jgi:hypothetical protein
VQEDEKLRGVAALAGFVEHERKLREDLARADQPVYAFGVGPTRRLQFVNGQITPVGPPVLVDLAAAVLKADTLGDLLGSLKLIEDCHQSNLDAVAEQRQLCQRSAEGIVPRGGPPDRRAADMAACRYYLQQARVQVEQLARMLPHMLKAWHEQLDSYPGVGRLHMLAQAEGLSWGRAAVVSLRARLCLAHEQEEAWADALPIPEVADLLAGMNREKEGRRKRADGKADDLKKNMPRIPRNHDVVKLAKAIKNPKNAGRPIIDIAREIAKGDETKAQSLARKLRDYPHLLG